MMILDSVLEQITDNKNTRPYACLLAPALGLRDNDNSEATPFRVLNFRLSCKCTTHSSTSMIIFQNLVGAEKCFCCFASSLSLVTFGQKTPFVTIRCSIFWCHEFDRMGCPSRYSKGFQSCNRKLVAATTMLYNVYEMMIKRLVDGNRR